MSASNYALLGGTAISVGGPGPNPIVNGNVGLSAAATTNITGFPPAVVSGNTLTAGPATIVPTGGATLQAGNDLITARNALFAMPQVPANDLSNLDFGTLAALRPGVYFSTSAVQQTGAIVLDANFQNGVAWVFDLSLSLTTAANSTVTFVNLGTNGGNDNGLYWNAATAITIGDNNTVLGNYMAGTSISFTGITNTLATGGVRALAGAAVSFAGPAPAGFNTTGGPGGGDFDGGLQYVGGFLVPIPLVGPPIVPVVIPPAPVYTGNVILSAPGLYVPGTSGVILVPGTSYPTSTLTLDGNSSNGTGPASLTINTATVTMTGTANTYTGGTIVNTGALIASSANLPVNGPVTLNTSILTFEQPAAGTFGGVISGNGTVGKQGVGTLTVTGANTYTGGTNVSAGTLVANTASLPVNGGVALLPVGTLVFNQTTDGTFGGAITGGGRVQKTGAGSLTMSNTTNSPVDVQAGSFFFNTGVGATTVSSGALLGGTGTVTGLLANNGTVSPGNSPGTINVIGNYTQSAGGKLLIEIASATSFDHLVVSGAAALAGSLRVDTLGGYSPLGQTFTFLTAPGGVSGTFGTFSTNLTGSAATAATVIYAPTSASVTFSQLPFAGFAETPNQVFVGNGGQNSPGITTALDAVPTAGEMPAALNAISPQGYQVWSNIAFAHGTALANRLARNARPEYDHDNYYFDVSQRRARASRDRDVGTTTSTSTSELVGGDHMVNADLAAGIFFEHARTISGLGSVGSRSKIKENMLGARLAWTGGPLFAHAMFGYGFDRYTSTRPIVFPGTNATATSATRGRQLLAGISGGQHFTVGGLTVSPSVGLLASRWRVNGFNETGAGVFNATVAKQSAHSLRSEAGVEAALNWKFGTVQVSPHVRGAWLHEFADNARMINGAFGPAGFAVKTRGAQRNSAILSAGVDVALSKRALVYADYSEQSGGRTRILGEWRAGLVISF